MPFYLVVFPPLMEFETTNEWKYGLSKKNTWFMFSNFYCSIF